MNNVISTTVNIYRNLKDYKFVNKLTEEQKQEIKDKVTSILPKELDVWVKLFDGEHITITKKSLNFDVSSYEKVNNISNLLSSKLAMSYSDEFGYLMSDLNKIGAGISLECELCLPALVSINKIGQVKQNVGNLGYILKEKQGSTNYVLSTTCNLGYSANEILENFRLTVGKLQDLEIESAKMLDVENHDDLLDKTLRSIAILSSAHMIRYDEFNNILSNIRMGLNLGMTDISIQKVDKLQSLLENKNIEFVSPSDMKDLANKVKQILKGE